MKSLLIAVAVQEEFRVVKKFIERSVAKFPIETIITSMGMAPARKSAEEIIDPAKHGGVLVLGYCGGLSPRLKTGDALVPSKVLADGPREIQMDGALCEALGRALISEGLNYRSAGLITQPRVLEKPEEKKAAFEKSMAEGVDMEFFEIADQARERDVRAAAVKFVVDDYQMELPPFNEYLESDGKLDQLQVKRVLMNHPALSLRLRQCMRSASANFERAVPEIVATVCRHWGIEKRV